MTQRPDLERSGLVAELLGFLALGHLDSARGRADRLRARFPEQDELALTTAAIEGAYSLADRAAGRTRSAARAVLDRHSTRQGGPAHLRRRAAWMLALLSLQEGSPAAAERYEGLLADEPAPAPLGAFLRANKMAAGGDQLGAIRASAWLVALDSAARAGDPMFRALLHLSRATWFEQLGNSGLEDARRELRWHENLDIVGYPTGVPQAAEIDWAMGTVARWRRANLLRRSGEMGLEACAAYAAVSRHWTGGDSVFATRADSARRATASLGCDK